MEYIASYILLVENGQSPTREGIVKLLGSIRAPVDEGALDLFMSKVGSRPYSEIVAEGSNLMRSQFANAASPSGATEGKHSEKASEPEKPKEEEEEEVVLDFF